MPSDTEEILNEEEAERIRASYGTDRNVAPLNAARANVLGVALSAAQAGEALWVLTQGNAIQGVQISMRAEEPVGKGDPVTLTGPTTVKPVRVAGENTRVDMVSSSYPWIQSTRSPGVPFVETMDDALDRVKYGGAVPRRPAGWAALAARVGKEGMELLEQGEPFTVQSRRWPGVIFGVKKDGHVAAVLVVREDGKPPDLLPVGEAPAPTYPGNGGPPPWPEVVLGRLVMLDADETLLFGTGELGGVTPVTRRMRMGEE